MSPTSNHIERLAASHGVPAPEALEYFLSRLAVRDGSESAALADTEIWAKLWSTLKSGAA